MNRKFINIIKVLIGILVIAFLGYGLFTCGRV